MALKAKTCCECLSTRAGAVVIGPVNIVMSFISLAFCMLYLFMFIVIDIDEVKHPETLGRIAVNFSVPNIILVIGILANVLHFAFCIILKIGIKKRKSKLVRSYMIVGTLSALLSALALVAGALSAITLLWCIIVMLVQVCFVIIIFKEYKKILADGHIKMPENLQP